jgi:hypothetical protein
MSSYVRKYIIRCCVNDIFNYYFSHEGHPGAQLVEALRCKPEGHGIFNRHFPSGRTVALGLTQPLTEMNTLISPCADGLEIWEPQPPGNFRTSTGL